MPTNLHRPILDCLENPSFSSSLELPDHHYQHHLHHRVIFIFVLQEWSYLEWKVILGPQNMLTIIAAPLRIWYIYCHKDSNAHDSWFPMCLFGGSLQSDIRPEIKSDDSSSEIRFDSGSAISSFVLTFCWGQRARGPASWVRWYLMNFRASNMMESRLPWEQNFRRKRTA